MRSITANKGIYQIEVQAAQMIKKIEIINLWQKRKPKVI